jgi:hypothetical protein
LWDKLKLQWTLSQNTNLMRTMFLSLTMRQLTIKNSTTIILPR